MSYLIGVLIFVVALLISVMLHEAGHFVTAKAFGMKATKFFVGFGNTVWSRVRGETEYGVKALPLGGFVEIVGMSNLDEVDVADEPRTFRSKPAWQRSVVLLAGSFMHFVIAIVLLLILAAGIGIGIDSTSVITVVPCIPASQTAVTCSPSAPKSPAVLAGLRTGDKVVAVAGHPVRNWNQLVTDIKLRPGGAKVPFTVSRDGRTMTVDVTLAGLSWRQGGYLGVQQTPVFVRKGPLSAFAYSGTQFGTIVTSSVQALGKLPGEIPHLFSANRAKNGGGVSSVVGVGEATGQVVSASGVSWQAKASFVLLIVASVNIFVGLFNLLPLLPLDGGKLAIVIFEWIRSSIARLRRKPDPGLVDMRRLIPLSVGFVFLFVCLGVLLIAADIINPIRI